MDMDKLNRWMTLLANVGVIAGIIVLAVEIQQNNEQLEIQVATTLHEIRMDDIGRIAMDEGLATALLKFNRNEKITDVERERLAWVFAVRFRNWEFNYQLGKLNTKTYLAAFGESPRAVEFWHQYRHFMDPEFVQYIDDNVISEL